MLRALLNPCWRCWDRIEKNEAAEEDAPPTPEPPSKQEIVDEDRPPAVKGTLEEIWKRVDKDKSGALDADEIHAVLLLMGRREADIEIGRVMKAIDKDGSGTVDFAEFEIWWKRGTPKVYLAKVISDAQHE